MLLGTVLLLGILFLFGCTSKEVTSAKVYIQQDDWAKAEEQLREAVRLYPSDAEAHILLAEALGRKGEYGEMVKEIDASLEIGPQFKEKAKFLKEKYWVEAFNKGVGKVKAEKFDEALAAFKQCPVIDPERIDAYKNMAFVYMRMNSVDEAIPVYEKVIELDPKDTKTMLQLGSIFYEKKDYEKAIEVMNQILAIEPGNIDAISQKAFAYDSMGQSEEAFNAYKEALVQQPGNPDILFNLGRLHFIRNEYDQAIEQFEKVLESAPDDLEATLNIGNAYLSVAEEYMKPLRKSQDLSKAEATELKEKAIENYKKAIPFLEKAVEARPNATVWTNLGVAYINIGEKEKGEDAFKKSEEMN
jgi:tetratricopeptide (TPR) repeat protein